MKNAGVFRLRQLLAQVQVELFPRGMKRRRVTQKGDLSGVRPEVVEKLVEAINEVESLAKTSAYKIRKGTGGVSPKVRWYQLMAYLAQTLDGVLRNIDLEKGQEKMDQLEMAVDELQRTTPKTGG